MSKLPVFSFGGGAQSNAVLVLAAQGDLPYHHFLFANVGEDSENPSTIQYVEQVSKPFARDHGLELIELRKQRRVGGTETLLQMMRRAKRSVPIPVRMDNGAPGNRHCTFEFKIRVVAKWLREEYGATPKEPATVGLGISWDEVQRMRKESGIAYELLEYPLIKHRITRARCLEIIREAGLPPPPRSACFFCPFHSKREWWRLKTEEPHLFEQAVGIERELNEKRVRMERDLVWLSPWGKPLDEALGDYAQPSLGFDEDDACDSGYCMT